MRKVGLLCLALVLALGTLGIGYATWSDNVTIEEEVYSGELCIEFFDQEGSLHFSDTGNDTNIVTGNVCAAYTTKGAGKDVGSCTGAISASVAGGPKDLLTVTCNDTYPCYFNHVYYDLYNCGTIPWRIQKVLFFYEDGRPAGELEGNDCVVFDFNQDGKIDMHLWWGDNFGEQIHPETSADMSFKFHIQQEAPQDSVLTFKVKIIAVQWAHYVAPD